MKRLSLLLVIVVCSLALASTAHATTVLVNSWENSQEGWDIHQAAYSSAGFSTTTGVTDATYSWAISGTAGPDYSTMLSSAFLASLTSDLANSTSVKVDVYTPPGSFGFFMQWSMFVNNADTGFQSVDSYSYSQSPVIGSQSTLTWTVPAGIKATLAGSANPTEIGFLIGGGFSAGNETFYMDNLRIEVVPEPASIGLMAFGGLALAGVAIRRRRA